MRHLFAACLLLGACQPAEDSRVYDHEHELADLRLKVQVLEEKVARLEERPTSQPNPVISSVPIARARLLGATQGEPMQYSSMAGCLAAKSELERQRTAEEPPTGYRVIHPSLSCVPVGG